MTGAETIAAPTDDILINGEPTRVPAQTALLAVVIARTGRDLLPDGSPRDRGRLGIAAAVNERIVPRGQWSSRVLHAGDRVEIVTAAQGG